MKKTVLIVVCALFALVCAVMAVLCIERVSVGSVGVVYSAGGVEERTLSQGWHLLSPFQAVKQFPISQQQLVLSNDPADYNKEEHADWSIDAPANGGDGQAQLDGQLQLPPGAGGGRL